MGEGFKLDDAGSYDELADRFDRLSDRHTARIAEALAGEVRRDQADLVVDVGCGSGLLTRRLSGRQVIGVDLSAGMLAVAKQRCDAEFVRADAESFGFRDDSVDCIASLFALLHLPDPLACLRECRRVLRVGGGIHVAFGAGPTLLSAGGLQRIGDELGVRLESGLRSPLRGPQLLDGIVEEMTGPEEAETTEIAGGGSADRRTAAASVFRLAGFANLRYGWAGEYRVIETIDDFWELQSVFSSFSRKRLSSATQAMRDAIRQKFDDRCSAALRAGVKMVYPLGAAIISGRKR